MANSSRPTIAVPRAFLVSCMASLLLFDMVAAFATPSPRCLQHNQQPQHFAATASEISRRSTQQYYMTPKHSPLEDEPWQKSDSYWDELQTASKDPVAFEKFIEESMARKKLGKEFTPSTASAATANGNADATAENGTPKKKSKYVPIEEWDESRKNGENMSKEERLQWECQRSGNQFRQNEILLHNLKGF
ncbi:hypothetical protein ACHAXR_013367 [Thalassiosira sp. AJA248-18]